MSTKDNALHATYDKLPTRPIYNVLPNDKGKQYYLLHILQYCQRMHLLLVIKLCIKGARI